ncbi:MAG: Ig-like domain repeat protein [Gemmataceae bacterium]|nr:Ig-like domain repeat protein [Gemmataceae bacterium]
MEQLEDRVTPAARFWDGGGATNLWSDAGNWDGTGNVPVDGDELIFLAGAANLTNVNDIDNLKVNRIAISGNGYNISGSPIVLGSTVVGSGFIDLNGPGITATVGLDITLGGDAGQKQFFTANSSTTSLIISGDISDATGVELSKNGTGIVVLAGDNSGFTGPITIVEGSLNVRHADALGDTLAVPDPDDFTKSTTVLFNSLTGQFGQLQIENVSGPIPETVRLSGTGPINDGALLNVAGDNVIVGLIVLDANSTIGSNAGNLTLQGQITDRASGHSITKEGFGKITLDPLGTADGNIYRGRTIINNGILNTRHSLALGNETLSLFGVNDTYVSATTNRSGTLQVEFVPNPARIDDFATATGFSVPYEFLTLNGHGSDGIHILPKQSYGGAQAGYTPGQTVIGALHNLAGVNTWVQDIQLWGGNAVMVFDPIIWSFPTVGIGAEAGADLIIAGRLLDDNITNVNYSLVKTGAGRVILAPQVPFSAPPVAAINTYRGRTEILQGYLNIRDSSALGAFGTPSNGTIVFPGGPNPATAGLGGTLEFEADTIPDSNPVAFAPDGTPHLDTDIVIGPGGEVLALFGDGAGGDGSLRNIRGTNENGGQIPLGGNIGRSGASFSAPGASVGVEPDYAPYAQFDLSQMTLSGSLSGGNLTKVGRGELVLTDSVNNYGGFTLIREGWITARHSNSLGLEIFPDTLTPATHISIGAALHLKRSRVGGLDIAIPERIFVSGIGIDHRDGTASDLNNAFPELHRRGAILNLSGNNNISGILNLVATPGFEMVGIGADIANSPWVPDDQNVTQSTLTFINTIQERDTSSNLANPAPLPPPGTVIPAGIEKLGRKRVILQGQGTFTGDNQVTEGVLRTRADTGLGVALGFDNTTTITPGNTTVLDGAAIEFEGYAITRPAGSVQQWANTVIDFSSEFSTTDWSAMQATGAPNTPTYGDIMTAWAPIPPDSLEYLTLGFATPVHANGVTVVETFSNGFVYQIDVVDMADQLHTVFTGVDPSLQNAPAHFVINFPQTAFLVKGVKVYVDGTIDSSPMSWPEIDAVELRGVPVPPPTDNTINGGIQGGVQILDHLVLNGLGNVTADDATHDFSNPSNIVSTLTNFADDNMIRSPITLGSQISIDVKFNSRMSLWKSIDGPGGFTKEGTGKLVLGGVNSYTGETTVNAGILNLQSSGALGTGSVNELQTVTVGGTSGAFQLRFNGADTNLIGLGASAATVRGELENLSTIGAGNVDVTFSTGVYTVTFRGTLSGFDQNELSVPAITGDVTAVVGTVLDGGGGTTVADNAALELQGDITIGGESLRMIGDGPDTAPIIPLRWFANGPSPVQSGQTIGDEDVTGRITGVAVDPRDTSIIYLSAAGGGAWRTRNGGLTWEPLVDNINGISIDPSEVMFTGAIAVAPTSSGVIYVGLGEGNNSGDSYYGRGLLRSQDYGRTWELLEPTPGAFSRVTISRIFVDPVEAETVYFTVQGNGVNGTFGNYGLWRYRPLNVAQPWENLTAGQAGPTGSFLDDGTHHYTDLVVLTAPDIPGNRIIAVSIGNTNGGGFGATHNAVYTTFNALLTAPATAITWNTNAFNTALQTVNGVAGHPRNGMIKTTGNVVRVGNTSTVTLYALVAFPFVFPGSQYGASHGTLREVDVVTHTYNHANGTWSFGTWGGFAAPPGNLLGNQGWYDATIVVHPGNAQLIFIGGVGEPFTPGPFFYNGAWQPVGNANNKAPHVDYHASTFDAQGRLVVGNDGGVWRLENANATLTATNADWTNLNGSFLQVTQFNGLDVHPFDPFFAIGGSQDNGTKTYDDSGYWTHTDDGDGGVVRINNRDPNFVFHVLNGQLRRSTDGGATWSNVPGISTGGLYFPFILDRVNPSRLLVGLGSNLRESLNSDGAQLYNTIGSAANFGPNTSFIQIAISDRQGAWVNDLSFPLVLDNGADSYDSDTIYVATSNGVFLTKNHGSSWVARNTGLNTFGMSDITVDPRNRDFAYVTRSVFGGTKVFQTTDSGRTWTPLAPANFPDVPAWKVIVNPRNSDIYVGTDIGVLVLKGGAGTWERFGVGLPTVQIKEMVLNTYTNMLSVGTYGRGLYQLWLDDSVVNGGALRAVTGSSLWTGDVIMVGASTIRAEVDATVNISGIIRDITAGANHTITKVGTGRVIFSGANTYGGLTDVVEGPLNARNSSALGSDLVETVVRAGAALELQADLFHETVEINGHGIPNLGHNTGALRNVSNANTFTGTLRLNTNTTVGVDSGSQLTIGAKVVGGTVDTSAGTGVIDDAANMFSLTKELAGTLILNAANNYDGLTDVIGGVLRVEHATALGGTATGTRVRNGAQLQLNRDVNGAGITVVNETLALSGTGIFSTGALQNFSGNNTWQGNVNLTGIQSIPAPPPPVPPTTINIGVLNAADTLTIDGVITEIDVTIPAQPPLIPAPVTLDVFGLTKVLPGKLVLRGAAANTYTGLTTVQTGVLNVQKPQALGTTAVGTVVNAGAALETEGGNITFVAETVTLNGRGVGPADLGALRNIAGNNTWTGPVILNSTVPAASPGANPAVHIGADVRAEVQTVTVTGSSGTFTLSFNGETTGDLGFDAAEGIVAGALNNLPTIGGIGGSVTVTLAAGVYTITFGGNLLGLDVPQIAANGQGGATATPATAVHGAISSLAVTGQVQDPAGVPASFKAAELHKVGDGTIIFPTPNTYQGFTVIDNGTLSVGHDGALGAAGTAANGTLVNAGGSLQTQGGFTETDELLTINGDGERGQGAITNNVGDNTWQPTITLGSHSSVGSLVDTLIINEITDGAGTLNVTKSGPTTVEYGGTLDNTYDGLTLVREGILRLNKSGGASPFGGTLQIGNAVGVDNSAVARLAQSDQVPDAADVTVMSDGLLDLAGLNDIIDDVFVREGRVATGAGVLTVVTVDMIGGVVDLAGRLRLTGVTGVVAQASAAGETALITGAGRIDLNGAPRAFNVTDGPSTVTDLRIAAIIGTGGSETLIKDGNGLMEIDSTNVVAGIPTYGSTQVNAGILQVDGRIDAVTLSGGTLGGNGFVGAVTSDADGGTENPGASPGILHSGDTLWNDATTFFVELNRLNAFPSALNAGLDYDQLQVVGSVNLNDAEIAGAINTIGIGIVTDDPSTSTPGDSFTILTATLGVTGFFTQNGVQIADGGSAFIGGGKFTVDYQTNAVVLTKVKASVTVDVTSNATATTVWGEPVSFTIDVTPEPGAGMVPASATVIITLTTAEIQRVVVGTSGTFSLTFNGQPTGPLNFDATAGDVAAALTGLVNWPAGGTVNVDRFGNEIVIRFGGTLDGANQTPLTGSGAAFVSINTLVDGQTFGPVARTLTNGQFSFDPRDLFGVTLDVGPHTVRADFQDPTNSFTDIDDPPFDATDSHVHTVAKADSTIALTTPSAGATSVYGEPVTITAHLGIVPPGGQLSGTTVLSGIVTFTVDNVQQLPPASVFFNGVEHVAQFALPTNLTVGDHTISAVYSGDHHFNSVPTTSDLVQHVIKADTAVTVSGAPNPSNVGQLVTFTVQVSAVNPSTGIPTGTVVIKDNGLTFDSHAVDASGQWQFQISTLTLGAHDITVEYQGDSNFNPSDSATTHAVNGVTVTNVVSSVNPSVFGQSVNFTATVVAQAPATGTPTGNVEFVFTGATTLTVTLTLVNGSAVLSSTAVNNVLNAGANDLTVNYLGVVGFGPSSDTLPTQTVNPANTTTSLTSGPAGTTVFGQNVTLTATVAKSGPGGGAPVGSVRFYDGGLGNQIGAAVPVNASGVAVLNTTALGAGTHTNIFAVFTDDNDSIVNFNSSTSNSISRTVNKANTTTVLASSVSPSSIFGQTAITATVTPVAPGGGIPTGNVTFFITNTVTQEQTQAVNALNAGGVATLDPPLNVGSYSIFAVYAGSADYNASANSNTIVQTVTKSDTTTTLATTNPNAVFGEAVITATIQAVAPGAGIPGGQVIFHVDNGATVTDVPITVDVNGVATLAPPLNVGSYTITADYTGNGNFNGSAGAAISQTVTAANSSVAVASSSNPSVFGQNVTFTATVSAVAPGAGVPTGTVDFFIDSVLVGNDVLLVNGQASHPIATLTVAGSPHDINVVYNGSTNFNASNGTLAGGQTVNPATTQTQVTSSANPQLAGQAVTFTATVSAVAPGSGVPTGTVDFIIDGSSVGSSDITLVNGQATFNFTTSVLGNHTVVVHYDGDASGNFATSDSATLNQEIKANTTTTVVADTDPSVFGQQITLTATVTGVVGLPPQGTVTFIDLSNGNAVLGTEDLDVNGATTLDISSLSVGDHVIRATYNGDDPRYFGSDGVHNAQTVNKADTTTGVGQDSVTTVFGEQVMFTATISVTAPGAGSPGGFVNFVIDGGAQILNRPVTAGQATLLISTLAVGSHTIHVDYLGDANLNGSSNPLPNLTHTVNKADTVVTVSSSANPSVVQQNVTFTATISAVAPGGGVPGGTVDFIIDGLTVGDDVPVTGGQAAFSTSSLGIGAHTVQVAYNGDAGFNAGSGALTPDQQVDQNPTAFILVPGAVRSGVPFTVVVHVRNAAGTGPDPTFNGPVNLAVNNGPGGLGGVTTVNAVGGVATFSNVNLVRAGSYNLRATATVNNVPLPSVISSNIEVLASSLIASVVPRRILVNRPFTINALAVDVTGNVAANYNGFFSLTILRKPIGARVTGAKFGFFSTGFGQIGNLRVSKAGVYLFRLNGPDGLTRTLRIVIRGRRAGS